MGAAGLDAANSQIGVAGKQSFLLDRFYVDGANPLLRNWTNDRFMLESRSPWPLVLYGPPGVGKTLLAETLVRRISKDYRYTTGPDFRRQFIEACETRSVRPFQDHFAGGDVLLIDNLVAPASETPLVSELVRLFDSYHEYNRPILVTMATAPFWEEELPLALRSRLSGGLSIAVQPPAPVARQAIIKQLLERYGLAVASSELKWLTGQLPKTVPALSREMSRIALNSQSKTKSTSPAPHQIQDREQLIEWIGRKPFELDGKSFSVLLKLVSRRFHLRGTDITGPGRQRQLVTARGVVAWIARRCFCAPYSRIGQLLGKRDASTIRHACDCIERLRNEDSRFEKLLQELSRNIENRTILECQNVAVQASHRIK